MKVAFHSLSFESTDNWNGFGIHYDSKFKLMFLIF